MTIGLLSIKIISDKLETTDVVENDKKGTSLYSEEWERMDFLGAEINNIYRFHFLYE